MCANSSCMGSLAQRSWQHTAQQMSTFKCKTAAKVRLATYRPLSLFLPSFLSNDLHLFEDDTVKYCFRVKLSNTATNQLDKVNVHKRITTTPSVDMQQSKSSCHIFGSIARVGSAERQRRRHSVRPCAQCSGESAGASERERESTVYQLGPQFSPRPINV